MGDHRCDKPGLSGVSKGQSVSAAFNHRRRSFENCISGSCSSDIVQGPKFMAVHHGGRIRRGMGGILASRERIRSVDGPLEVNIDKCKGAASNSPRSLPLASSTCKSSCDNLHGQRLCSCSDQEERVRQVHSLISNPGADNRSLRPSFNQDPSQTRRGIPQCHCGQLVEDDTSSVGVVPPSRQVCRNLLVVGDPPSRSLCHSVEQQDGDIRISSSDGGTTGLFDNPVGPLVADVCISTQQTSPEVSSQSSQHEGQPTTHPHFSILAQADVVPLHPISDSSRSNSPRSSASSSISGRSGVHCLPRQSIDFESSRGAVIKHELSRCHWSEASISVVDHSLRPQSTEVYERFWSEFMSFASSQVSSISDISLSVLTSFLHHLAFSRKLRLSTIKSYVSAIKFPLELILKQDITSSSAYSKFMRGLVNLMPYHRPPPVAWNLEVVLSHLKRLEPMNSLSPHLLRYKCLFLVAIASGKRVSELTHLGWDDPFLRFSRSSVSLIYTPDFLSKTENPCSLHAPLIIKSLSCSAPDPDERYVCPVRALHYWRAHIRKMTSRDPVQLFQLPSGAKASVRDISKSLVEVIKSSHASLEEAEARLLNVKAHDIRAVAASRVWSLRPSWSDLASSFNWKNRSVFISVYSRGISALKSIRND